MNFKEAIKFRENYQTNNPTIKDINNNDMSLIIVPKNNIDRAEYFNRCRGRFSDLLASNYSNDYQFEVIAFSYTNKNDISDIFTKSIS